MSEKRKSLFDETRNQTLHRLYPHQYADLEDKVKFGRTWRQKGDRQRVRALALQETRLHVRQLREVKKDDPKSSSVLLS